MKRILPVDELARDERFVRIKIEDVDLRPAQREFASETSSRQTASRSENADAPDAARGLMHGIFVGEIQALEGAGRTCFDFDDDGARRRSS